MRIPTEKLTDRRVNAATTTKERIDIFDAIAPGLSLRVTKAGSKSWIVNYRSPILRDRHGRGKPMRFMLGKYPAVELATARDQARDVMRRIAKGEDPQLEKRQTKPTGSVHKGTPVTVTDGVQRYIDEHVKVRNKPRKRADGSVFWEREQLLERHVIANLGGMAIHEVARKDVMAMHRQIEKDAGTTAADRAAEALRAAFNWLEDAELVENVPHIRLAKKARRAGTTRHRVLSGAEIAALWNNLDDDAPFGAIVRLLLLTGQRRSEVAEMRWEELDLDNGVWEIPAARTKNSLPHLVPLSELAVAILKDRERLGDYVFTSTGSSPFSGFSRSKKRLDGRLGFKEGWTLHDLRRTFVTQLNELGVPPHVVEACVNHVSGIAKAGVAGVYNKAEYLPERKSAMSRWATALDGFVNGKPSQIINLKNVSN